MKTYTVASDAEAKALHDGTQTVIVMPTRQECVGYVSFPPGDVIGVKEAVATDGPWNIPSKCHYWYPADGGKQPKGYRLRSAYHAPIQALRTFLRILHVDAKRVQSMTEEESLAAGIDPKFPPAEQHAFAARFRFAAEWDARHPALPWSANPWAWFYTVRRDDL